MLSAFLLSFGVIFVAELGDKSQLMAMAFAARYKAWPVLIGISIATAFTHAISVGIGAVVGAQLPTDTIAIIAGVAFLVFAAWTLRGDRLDDDEVEAADRKNRNAIVAASALAIVVGQQLGARLPERTIRIGASVLFVVFGVVLILEGV